MTLDVAAFDAQGYVHVPGVIDPALCAAITTEILPHEHPLEAWNTTGVLRGDKKILHHSPTAKAAADGPLLDLAKALIGETARLSTRTLLITKPPAVGQSFPWHQDSAYYGRDAARYVIVTLYLDPALADNGPLAVIPGSHRQGLIAHDKRPNGKRALFGVTTADAVIVPAQVGDVVCLDLHLVHGSAPNTSDRPRRTIRYGYLT